MEEIIVRSTNKMSGPIPIHQTWDPSAKVRMKTVRSKWVKGARPGPGGRGTIRKKFFTRELELPTAVTLYPGGELRLPKAAANSTQIAGLHASGFVRVYPAPTDPTDTVVRPVNIDVDGYEEG